MQQDICTAIIDVLIPLFTLLEITFSSYKIKANETLFILVRPPSLNWGKTGLLLMNSVKPSSYRITTPKMVSISDGYLI